MAGVKGASPRNLANPIPTFDLMKEVTPNLSALPSPQINAPVPVSAPSPGIDPNEINALYDAAYGSAQGTTTPSNESRLDAPDEIEQLYQLAYPEDTSASAQNDSHAMLKLLTTPRSGDATEETDETSADSEDTEDQTDSSDQPAPDASEDVVAAQPSPMPPLPNKIAQSRVAANTPAPHSLPAPVDVPEDPNEPSDAGAFMRAGANAATFGYSPQVAGAASAATGGNYISGRDAYDAQLARDQTRRPIATGMGNFAGAAASGLLPGVGTGVRGAQVTKALMPSMFNAAKTGLFYGLVANPGDVRGEVNPVQPLDRMVSGAEGAAGGVAGWGLIHGGLAGLTAVTEKIANMRPSELVAKAWDAVKRTMPGKELSDKMRLMKKYPTPQVFHDAIDDVYDLTKLAHENGIPLNADEAWQGDPILSVMKDAARGSPIFEKGQVARAKTVAEIVTGWANAFSERAGAMTPGKAVQKLSTADRVIGEEIGAIRDTAESVANDTGKLIPTTRLQAILPKVQEDLGLPVTAAGTPLKMTKENIKNLAVSSGTDEAQLTRFTDIVLDLIESPEMHPKEMMAKQKELIRMINSNEALQKGSNNILWEYGIKVKDALRDDYIQGLRQYMPKSMVGQYEQALSRYSNLKSLPQRLDKLLDPRENGIFTDDIMTWLHRGGIDNKEAVTEFMRALDAEVPQGAEAIRQHYVARIIAMHADTTAKGAQVGANINWPKFNEYVSNPRNKEVLNTIFGGSNPKFVSSLENVSKVMKRVYDGHIDLSAPAGFSMVVRALVSLSYGSPSLAVNLLSQDKMAQQIIHGPAFEKGLKLLSERHRKTFLDMVGQLSARGGAGAATGFARDVEQVGQ